MSSSLECTRHQDHHLKKEGNRNKQLLKELRHGKQRHIESSSRAQPLGGTESHTQAQLCTIKMAETNINTH